MSEVGLAGIGATREGAGAIINRVGWIVVSSQDAGHRRHGASCEERSAQARINRCIGLVVGTRRVCAPNENARAIVAIGKWAIVGCIRKCAPPHHDLARAVVVSGNWIKSWSIGVGAAATDARRVVYHGKEAKIEGGGVGAPIGRRR